MKDEKFSAVLSRREKDVVDLLLQGKSNKQIALALGVSERTVEFHLYFHTQRNVVSDSLWLMSSVCMLVLFAFGYLSGKWHIGRGLAAAL